MKKLAILFIFCLITFYVNGEKWIGINSDTPIPAEISLISSNIESSIIHFRISGFMMNEVETPRGTAHNITIEKGTFLLEKGAPNLGKLTTSLIIPDRANMTVEIISSKYIEYKEIEVAPSKGNLTRDIDPATVAYLYNDVYEKNDYYPGVIAKLRDPYIVRDHRGQTLIVYPFRYNPVTKTLRVYTDITVKVYADDQPGINPLIRQRSSETVSKDFNTLYNRHFLNAGQTRYTPVEEEGNMLIICYGDFMDAMQPFIEWKTLSGRPVEMVDVAEIGNADAIKTYVENYYNTYGLTYLLLVGDAPQVPSSYSNGDSDNNYGYIVGDDHYPDVFVGRFSAETIEQLDIQIERTLEYEKTPYSSFDWFTRSVGIASSQGPGDDNEYDYEHIRNMQSDLLDFTYTYNGELFDGSQGGNDATGNPTPAMVSDEVNTGTSIMLYTGHGSTTSWSTSGFSNSHVDQLENDGMYPFIWSVACVNGNFVSTTCFAEAWLRSKNEVTGSPAGAVATLMSTINQSWDPPMEGQDEMVDILVESYTDNIKRTFAGISMNGCMKMNDSYGSGGFSMTDTWTCFGDPSVIVRTAQPLIITADYQDPIPLYTTELEVSANCPGGLVTLTNNGEIIATAYIEGGTANLTFTELTEMEPLDIVITAFNCIPYIAQIDVVGEPGPVINPSPGNGVSKVDPFTKFLWIDGPGGIPETFVFFLGTDNPPANLINGEITSTHSFSLPADLEYETEYFWRVDASNEFGTAVGDVWSFTTHRPPDENYENANFRSHFWNFEGDAAWEIDGSDPFNGTLSARSGVIGNNESSSMKITLNVETLFFSEISFYRKVSTAGGDKLQFLIDEEIVDQWSGTFGDYGKVTYQVSDGLHTFEWRYVKDESGVGGEDCCWIDYIYFPTLGDPFISAGDDSQVCEGLDYIISAQGYNFCYLEWTTSGNGTFDDNTTLSPLYTPGNDDLSAGEVNLTVTAHTSDGGSISDGMLLTFDPLPAIPDIPVGPDYVDLFYTTSSEYECINAPFASEYIWDINPDYAGSLDGDGPICVVNWDPSFLGIATITVKGVNDCGEGEFSEGLEVTVDNTVGLDEGLSAKSIRIIPNPNNGEFKLEIKTTQEEKVNIRIMDVIGNMVYDEPGIMLNNGFTKKFDLTGLRKGLYVIFIEGKESATVKKFVIR